ncbi:MAG TPA: lipase secretion chaperone [Noviherbaspirillum sp.]|uniref:lipase secretion chaperone n=1 Tax=Noviherbaspirillum sp. TaxID=1926288 RepID=UPI002B4653BC|nr:lipase secretion chaperone [Noviherbaspirillum sp.]HJV85187.1 lipase secretion chaperone [Noviherbaspirillum sp.]
MRVSSKSIVVALPLAWMAGVIYFYPPQLQYDAPEQAMARLERMAQRSIVPSAPQGNLITTQYNRAIFRETATGDVEIDSHTTDKLDVLLRALPQDYRDEELERVEQAVQTGLSAHAAERAGQLLRTYLAYRDTEAALLAERRGDDVIDAADMFRRISGIRHEFFGRDADALFGAKEAEARVSLEAARIASDPGLSKEQQAQRIAALQATLPRKAGGDSGYYEDVVQTAQAAASDLRKTFAERTVQELVR